MFLTLAVAGSYCSEVPWPNEAGEWTTEISEGNMVCVFAERFGLRSENDGLLGEKGLV